MTTTGKMKKYKVEVEYTMRATMHVEAATEQDALAMVASARYQTLVNEARVGGYTAIGPVQNDP